MRVNGAGFHADEPDPFTLFGSEVPTSVDSAANVGRVLSSMPYFVIANDGFRAGISRT